ncbi:MAG: DNA mismatch repair protein MutS, partial [Rickettsiales bacterium]|jgi:DNA mismatch repair protein MutS|nr:DNA mismatch repair protein MutS [Rickettsiales bacterium]
LPDISILLSAINFENNEFLDEYDITKSVLKFCELKDVLTNALSDNLPLLARDGGFIKKGFNPSLDELKEISENANSIVSSLQEKYKNESKAISLKIKHNNILGYYIEVPSKQADYLLKPENGFIHRQTLMNGIRFTTPELAELQSKIESADARLLALELEIFEELNAGIKLQSNELYDLCNRLASLDVFASLGELAREHNFCKPELNDTSNLVIEKGRHPVVEKFLRKELKDFIPNDCIMKELNKIDSKVWLLTGPNMAGKSTYLRANALIVFMAHCGFFVPAEKAIIGTVDKIFSRIGASDNLSKGQSTFMTEMIETAAILNQATNKSFVILDEIGRGTSTYDGVSIASAVLQYIHNVINCRTLFATHYHELTQLSNSLQNLSNHTMEVKEFNNDVIFMHTVQSGRADKSYGIWVAKLAGIPTIVINNAKKILEVLEKNNRNDFDLPLFNVSGENEEVDLDAIKAADLLEKLRSTDTDNLTPLDAMKILYDLKRETT